VNDLTDQQLLRDYARERSEVAFAQLVERHIDFVYSAARRMLPDAELAKDVTQLVFLAAAKNASNLCEHPFLSGWLHRTTRNLAAKAIRSEAHRRIREQEAATMKQLLSPESEPGWEQLSAELDFGIAELRNEERDALLLRYFERKSAREMGTVLGISEQAAQKRVNRAVERLRAFFAERGVAVETGSMATLLAANAVEAAPAGMAASVSASVIVAAAGAQTSAILTLTKAITMSTIQKAAIGTILAASIGGVWYQSREAGKLRERVERMEKANRQQVQQLQEERDQLAGRVKILSAETESNQSNVAEMARLRGELGRVRAMPEKTVAAKGAAEVTAEPAKREIPKDAWTDAGLETPEAALKTRGWCVVNGNRERFKESVFVTDGARKMLEDMFVQMAEQSKEPNKEQLIQMVLDQKLGVEEGLLMPMMAENKQVGYTGFQIVSDQTSNENEHLLVVETSLADGRSKQENLKLRRFGTDWKVVVDEDSIRAAQHL
jgi:RNA polymerase sigma factor (sigma-70 family)